MLRYGDVHRNRALALAGAAAIGVAAFAGSIATAHSSKPEGLGGAGPATLVSPEP